LTLLAARAVATLDKVADDEGWMTLETYIAPSPRKGG
jgi:hypothetical protein